MVKLSIIMAFLLFSSLTSAKYSCNALFSGRVQANNETGDPWLIDSKQAKAVGSEQNIYAANAREAVNNIFAKWLEADEAPCSFLVMIKMAHLVAAVGMGAEPRSYATSEYSSLDIFPGRTRSELAKVDGRALESSLSSLSLGFLDQLQNRNDRFSPALVRFAAFQQGVESAYRRLQLEKIEPGDTITIDFGVYGQQFVVNATVLSSSPKGGDIRIRWSNKLDGFKIPQVENGEAEKVSRGLVNEGNVWEGASNSVVISLKHRVPEPEFVELYIKRGETLMTEIRALLKTRARGANVDIDKRITTLLADYYQVMINAHPFVRINHSLFMNQVNYVLLLMGRKPLAHSDMDFLAMILDSAQFRGLFLAGTND